MTTWFVIHYFFQWTFSQIGSSLIDFFCNLSFRISLSGCSLSFCSQVIEVGCTLSRWTQYYLIRHGRLWNGFFEQFKQLLYLLAWFTNSWWNLWQFEPWNIISASEALIKSVWRLSSFFNLSCRISQLGNTCCFCLEVVEFG